MDEEIKVSELPVATDIKNDDVLMIVQDDVNKQMNVLNINKYSTTETKIGTWIDRKPLYRIYITFFATVTESTWSDLVDVSSLNVDKLVNCTLFRGYVGDIMNPTYVRVSNGYLAVWDVRTGDTIAAAILEYTKTTD